MKYLLSVILSMILSSAAIAQDIKFSHTPITEAQLPFPGKGLSLSIHLTNTRNPSLPVRGLILRDGQLIDVLFKVSTFDKSDRIVYSATIPAPKESLQYKFVLTKADGSTIQSENYEVHRSCKPKLSLTAFENSPQTASREEGLLPLLKQSRGLEKDVEQYEIVIRQLEAFKQVLDK